MLALALQTVSVSQTSKFHKMNVNPTYYPTTQSIFQFSVSLHNTSVEGKWAATWQNEQNECVPSEDPDQPGQPSPS